MIGESTAGVATRIARQTLKKILSSQAHATRAAKVAARLQEAHQAAVRTQESLLHSLGFATASDYRALTRQASRLKRRARSLRDALERRAAESDLSR